MENALCLPNSLYRFSIMKAFLVLILAIIVTAASGQLLVADEFNALTRRGHGVRKGAEQPLFTSMRASKPRILCFRSYPKCCAKAVDCTSYRCNKLCRNVLHMCARGARNGKKYKICKKVRPPRSRCVQACMKMIMCPMFRCKPQTLRKIFFS